LLGMHAFKSIFSNNFFAGLEKGPPIEPELFVSIVDYTVAHINVFSAYFTAAGLLLILSGLVARKLLVNGTVADITEAD